MTDRVFPNNLNNDQLASEKEFNGINWDSVFEKIACGDGCCEKRTNQFPESANDILQVLNELGEDDNEKPVKEEKVASTETDEDTKEKNEVEKQVEEDENEMLRKGDEKTASTRIRKIRFTNPDQLSAEAITAAREAGDEDLVKAILAARQQRRVRIASKINESYSQTKDVEQKLEQRHAFRMKMINEFETRLAETAGKKEVTAKADAVKKVAMKVKPSQITFKKVADMSSKERKAFAQRAEALGFPKEYIEQMLGVGSQKVATANVEGDIREVMASKIPAVAKKAALAELVKTAKLDDEQISRCVKYWKEELGYGDAEWIDKLFKTKYDGKNEE